ncbi:MAG: bifunctional phosphoribosylaminoimidazolecarboxamide formyltransferase/IMP cyclohydrolase [candidate division NC10 bacterium]|nr:bifunctional phosphoribosylaminoimidazolecarboxamide formyltransferase/IMP cyclohydrolase [candidate division NC10 bacterium]
MTKIERALISVYNKEGIVDFVQGLRELGVRIISTGGTTKSLRQAGIEVTEVSELTGFPEMLDGRVKTLHPVIHGAILARRDDPSHHRQLREMEILPIDLVVINLYPFRETITKEGTTLEEALENIDIGGPAMIRSAAKNFQGVAVVVDPADYSGILGELRQNQGAISPETRFRLAQKAFTLTARYDGLIVNYLEQVKPARGPSAISHQPSALFPGILSLRFEKVQELRYGENPHQRAAFYRDLRQEEPSLASARQLQGKELSFNNILDLDAGLALAREFPEPVAVIIKHNNPCGVAVGENQAETYRRARDTDLVSAYGGILGFNRPLEAETAKEIAGTFVEAIIAPGYTEEALATLKDKKNLRLLEVPSWGQGVSSPVSGLGSPVSDEGWDMRKVAGGLLVQERDLIDLKPEDLQVVTKRGPADAEMLALRFAWRVVKHVKSNAIVLSTETETVGIGAGQMSRVDSVKIAIMKAKGPTKGTVLASDAFLPFRDCVEVAATAGVTALIQPGGSMRDQEVITACDEYNIAMLFTGVRHFRH